MIVWGGVACCLEFLQDGGRYDPLLDAWSPISTLDAPAGRYFESVVWTGQEMIVWGGFDGSTGDLDSGGRYDPVMDRWRPVSMVAGPQARSEHSAVWAGDRMIVWGGNVFFTGDAYGDGFSYDPAADRWAPISAANAPSPRFGHSAIWTGREMVVWGGAGLDIEQTGGRYDPSLDRWSPVSTQDAPPPRLYHTALWTGSSMIVWGGSDDLPIGSGGIYGIGGPVDSDGDGYTTCGGDCDDADASVNPGAVDLPGNPADEDCDGSRSCDPRGPWALHGAYLRCVVRQCAALVTSGLVSEQVCQELVQDAARSDVGRKARRHARPPVEP